MKNQSKEIKKNQKDSQIQKENISIIQDAIKGKKGLYRIWGKNAKGEEIELSYDNLSQKDKKSYRSMIRKRLDKFASDILGKDRSKEDKEKSLKLMDAFYQKYFSSNDYSIGSMMQSRKLDSRSQDIKNLLGELRKFKGIK